jgi:hypothetical protein
LATPKQQISLLWFSFRIEFYALVFQPRYHPNLKFHEQRGHEQQQEQQATRATAVGTTTTTTLTLTIFTTASVAAADETF